MKALLVCPKFPPTFWSFEYALQLADIKAPFSPLGLLTVASMLPREWEKKLIDMNVEPLKEKDVKWADYVFISAMDIQQKSAMEVVRQCNKLGIKIVAGGPFFTEYYKDFENVAHLFLGEAETTFPVFLEDLERGTPKHLYVADDFPDIKKSPPPMWGLAAMKKYSYMGLQYSRGCPFDCEFCQITKLFGRQVRTKSKEQITEELDSLYKLGWRGGVFFVDDNFIGNKHKLKNDVLPAIIEWMEKNDYPFVFCTQASINLADDEELMRMMVRAGFDNVFVGIETIDDDCLAEVGKVQNRNRNLVESVKKLQRSGLEVDGGFIVGFDNDKESIFDKMTQFIQESGITTAMVGLLSAVSGTRLYERLRKEGRLISNSSGDNTDFTFNFIPKMDKKILLDGYRKMLKSLYSPEQYYLRIHNFLREFNPSPIKKKKWNSYCLEDICRYAKAFVKIIITLGVLDEGRIYFWKLFFWSLLRKPRVFIQILTFWAQGYHCRKIFGI